jgi:hypothetical protein
MTFPLTTGTVYMYMYNNYQQQPRRKTVVIEEILKDSLRIEHDIQDVQKLVNELENVKTQDDMMKYIVKIQKDLQDIYVVSQQVYSDIKELVHY